MKRSSFYLIFFVLMVGSASGEQPPNAQQQLKLKPTPAPNPRQNAQKGVDSFSVVTDGKGSPLVDQEGRTLITGQENTHPRKKKIKTRPTPVTAVSTAGKLGDNSPLPQPPQIPFFDFTTEDYMVFIGGVVLLTVMTFRGRLPTGRAERAPKLRVKRMQKKASK